MKFRIKLKESKERRGLLDWGLEEGLSPEKRRKIEEMEAARLRSAERGGIEGQKKEKEEEALPDDVVVAEVDPTEFGNDEEVVEAVVEEVEDYIQKRNEREKKEECVRERKEQGISPALESMVKAVKRVKKSPRKRVKLTEKAADRNDFLRKLIDYGILGLIVFSPIPKTSVNEWSVMLIELVVFALMVAYFLIDEKPQHNVFIARSLVWPKRLFIALFIFLFVQILPLPSFLVKLLSPNAHSFRDTFSAGGANPAFMSLSLIAPHTIRDGLELLAYFLLGFLIIKTVTRQKQINRLFYVLVAMGVFQALYGFIELYNSNPRLLFYKKEHYLDALTGTFVNRNHLSGYLEMVIPLAIGLILARTDLLSAANMKWRERLLRLSEKGVYQNLLVSIGIVIMGLGIILSKSRSGVFLLVFIFILFLGFSTMFYRRSRPQQIWMRRFIWAVVLVVIFISLYVGIDATIERFALDEILREGRPTVWGNTAEIVSDFPLFGSGLGTFTALYPAYEKVKMQVRYSHAHNDYLQYLSELGIVGMIFLLGGILYILVTCFRAWRERRRAEVKGLGLGGIVAVVVILIHSITDFNLQIPANMMLFVVVLSLTLVIVFYKRN